MSQQQHFAQVQQWAEMDEAQAEIEARRIEHANAVLQEIAEAREREEEAYRRELEERFPILKGWV